MKELAVSRVWLSMLVSFVLAAFFAGCGDSFNLKPTTGTVTYNGAPVEGASVVFVPESNGIPGTATTDSAGKFTVSTNGNPGATVGKNKVMINKTTSVAAGATTGSKPEDMMKMYQKMGRKAGTTTAKALIPAKYATTEGSGLTAEVKATGTNDFPFELKD